MGGCIHAKVERLRAHGILVREANGAELADLSAHGLNKPIIVRADGETVYLVRDLAAAWHRHSMGFDKLLYVTGTEQKLHFEQLFRMLRLTGADWVDKCQHVEFGHVRGMRTRHGTAIFLEDLMNDARDHMLDVMRNKRDTTKQNNARHTAPVRPAAADPEKVAEALGLAALVVQDLRSRRIKDYSFDLARVCTHQGDTGPYLQYTHARLCSLQRTHGFARPDAAQLPAMAELLARDAEAVQLARSLLIFENSLAVSLAHLEPAPVVNDLLTLARAASAALECLPVTWQGTPPDVAAARAALFSTAQSAISFGLTLLGLTPLQHV